MEFHDFVSEIDISSPFSRNATQLHKLTYYQNEMINFIHDNQFSIIYKKRQEGVSTAISVYLLWLLITKSNFKIAMVSSSRSEKELFRQMINSNLDIIENIFRKKNLENVILSPSKHNQSYTEFANGSKIIYWMTNNKNVGKGHSVDLLYLSELTFSDNYSETIQCLFPCITLSNGKLIITSTHLTNLKEDFFMNGDGIEEYWSGSLHASRRFVITEKFKKLLLKSVDFKL